MAFVRVAPKTPFAFVNNPSNPGRDDSFSSYLALVRESFPPDQLGSSAPERLSCQISLTKRRNLGGEIEIFNAEKYFSGAMDGGDVMQIPGDGLKIPPAEEEAKGSVSSKSRAGSLRSETTSCNSRKTLLSDRRRQREPAKSKRFLRALPCSLCARSVAVEVNKEAVSDTTSNINLKTPQESPYGAGDVHLVSGLRLGRASPGLQQQVTAFPPNLNSVARRVTVRKDFRREEQVIGGVSKVVFGTDFRGRKGSGQNNEHDDVRSESSSDLFEIESISTRSHPPLNYEPSEASVEWSVATASVANFSTALELDGKRTRLHKTRRASGSGLLLGCASEKAINVTAMEAVSKISDETAIGRTCERSELEGYAAPTARYRAESCGVDLGSSRDGAGAVGSCRSSRDLGGGSAPAWFVGN